MNGRRITHLTGGRVRVRSGVAHLSGDGVSLNELVNTVDALGDAQPVEGLLVDPHDGRKRTLEEQAEIAGSFFRETGLARAMQMPAPLRTAEERYLIEVFETPGPGYWTEGASLRDLAGRAFREGLPPTETAEQWRKLAAAKLGLIAHKPRSRKR